jgi:hypothetical protein
MEQFVRLRCQKCGRTTLVVYEPPLGEPLDAAAAMAKIALRIGWDVNTVISRLDGSVLAHDLCPEHAERKEPKSDHLRSSHHISTGEVPYGGAQSPSDPGVRALNERRR